MSGSHFGLASAALVPTPVAAAAFFTAGVGAAESCASVPAPAGTAARPAAASATAIAAATREVPRRVPHQFPPGDVCVGASSPSLAALRSTHSLRERIVTSTSGESARSAPTVASAFGISAKAS